MSTIQSASAVPTERDRSAVQMDEMIISQGSINIENKTLKQTHSAKMTAEQPKVASYMSATASHRQRVKSRSGHQADVNEVAIKTIPETPNFGPNGADQATEIAR